MIFNSLTASVQRGARDAALSNSNKIILSNVLRSTTPDDLRKAIVKTGVTDIQDVAMDYRAFKPTGDAIVTFRNRSSVDEALVALKNFSVCGIQIPSSHAIVEDTRPQRGRGIRGRIEAEDNGALPGNGPHAGLLNSGTNVYIAGFPGKTWRSVVEETLRDFDLVRTKTGEALINRKERDPYAFTLVSQFIVKMSSLSEAHRAVRTLHLTPFNKRDYGSRFLLRLHIIH